MVGGNLCLKEMLVKQNRGCSHMMSATEGGRGLTHFLIFSDKEGMGGQLISDFFLTRGEGGSAVF